jgi:hypothetical protein
LQTSLMALRYPGTAGAQPRAYNDMSERSEAFDPGYIFVRRRVIEKDKVIMHLQLRRQVPR